MNTSGFKGHLYSLNNLSEFHLSYSGVKNKSKALASWTCVVSKE